MFEFFAAVAGALAVSGPVVKNLGELARGALDLCKLAEWVWKRVCQRVPEAQRQPVIRRALTEAASLPPQQFEQKVHEIIERELADQSPADRQAAKDYLSLIPEMIRTTFRSKKDPSGRTLPDNLNIQRSLDLLPFLPPRPPRFKVNDPVPGKPEWIFVERLGIGGFAEVWKARHQRFANMTSVIKICLDPQSQERLVKHEATILNQILRHGRHPGIVALRGVSLGSDPPWLEYEYAEGGDLHQFLLRHPWPVEKREARAWSIIRTLAGTLGYFHRLNPKVIHRDIKPSNVFLQRRANGAMVCLIGDFGIGDLAVQKDLADAATQARQPTFAVSGLSTSLRFAHTAMYASPQQKAGAAPQPTDDIYALGVMWYQLLVGDPTRPMDHEWRDELEALGVSPATIDHIAECVRKDATKRPADGTELAQRLAGEAVAVGSPPSVQSRRAGSVDAAL
ncbi:MAG: serine/threonine protein kinase [Gemmataceae bacterium]|nr:serine/threonine protein kinase [Gemmataceae bacterium]MDW8265617.1 serine/threonine-protein kinase [Gemmataceae bacterium]